MNPDVIEQFVQAGPKLREAMRGLTREDLLAHPIPGTWSIQQIVLHLMDSDLIWTDRLKRIIAEDNPTLIGYDESRFASNLFYDDQSADDAVAIFDLNRRQFARIVRKLPPAAFGRKGVHNERGEIQLGPSLEMAVWHVDHHLKFLYEKRVRLGKPLPQKG